MRAFLQYYQTISLFNFCFNFLVAFGSLSLIWFPISFCTAGFAFGLFAFSYYHKQQYYFYHNLGYTRNKLMSMAFITNLALSVLLLAVILLF